MRPKEEGCEILGPSHQLQPRGLYGRKQGHPHRAFSHKWPGADNSAERILRERENGPFTSIKTFCLRVNLPQEIILRLSLAGAFLGLPLNERRYVLVDRESLDLFLTESDLMQVSASVHTSWPLLGRILTECGFIQSNALKWKSHGSLAKDSRAGHHHSYTPRPGVEKGSCF